MKESSGAIFWVIGICIFLFLVASGLKAVQKLSNEAFRDRTTQEDRELAEKQRQKMQQADAEQKRFWRDQQRNSRDMKRMK